MSSNSITTKLFVVNMTCVNCENTIERALTDRAGIESVTASYSNGTVIVTYDPDQIELEQIEKIIEEHDYQVKRQPDSRAEKEAGKGAEMTTYLPNIVGAVIIIVTLYMLFNRFGLTNIFYSFPIAKEGMGYGMLFIIGLLTSVHCVAMCGGICISQCASKKNDATSKANKLAALRPSLLYNTGRVISYTMIGGIVGAVGSVVSFSGTMKGIVQILTGLFMIIMGLNMMNLFPWLRKLNPRMPKIFAKKIYAQRQSNSPFYIGLLNGLMPCGPLQAMQLYALSTGSPIKGAISMFLFSVGTVPLMFAFGALSSLLSKKFTSKMMSVSAVLVLVLGIFMFSSGASLSGISLPTLPSTTSQAKEASIATLQDGIQTVTTGLSSGRYEPIIVQKGIPVKWIIQAETGDINGCNNSIIVPKFNIQKDLKIGDNIIEFTPTESGKVPFSCWMGMIRSQITVVDNLNQVDSQTIEDASAASAGSSAGSCCAGGGAGPGGQYSGPSSYNIPPAEATIPTEELAIGKVVDGVQSVELHVDENGFSPAVMVVQRNLETKWIINGTNAKDRISMIFPYYNAQLDVQDGENPITFYPDQDFYFYTLDNQYYGYVKVVDDINNIDIKVIQKEISEY
jgi:uncharacterized protein